MFKAAKVERKIREINLLINMQINLYLCITSDCYFSLCLQRLSWDLLRTKNVLSTYESSFWKANKSWWQKRCGRNYIAYIFQK